MGVDLFDIVSYPVWKLALLLLGAMALSYFYGWVMAYEKFNERNKKALDDSARCQLDNRVGRLPHRLPRTSGTRSANG